MRVTAKEVQQTRRRGCSARFVEPEPACDIGLERRSEAVLGATDRPASYGAQALLNLDAVMTK